MLGPTLSSIQGTRCHPPCTSRSLGGHLSSSPSVCSSRRRRLGRSHWGTAHSGHWARCRPHRMRRTLGSGRCLKGKTPGCTSSICEGLCCRRRGTLSRHCQGTLHTPHLMSGTHSLQGGISHSGSDHLHCSSRKHWAGTVPHKARRCLPMLNPRPCQTGPTWCRAGCHSRLCLPCIARTFAHPWCI